jgi:hypothetical protein
MDTTSVLPSLPTSPDRDAISVDDVRPSDISAIEAYRAGEMAPETYDRGCGAIVIWTKR